MLQSAAERMKKYRERLKNNPEKYEEHRKKNLERVKSKKKKINEMSDEEKLKQRKMWLKHKKTQRKRDTEKKNVSQEENSPCKRRKAEADKKQKQSSYLATKCKRLTNTCKKYIEQNKKLLAVNNSLRKKVYRTNIQFNKKTMELDCKINKMKIREEVLENTLKKTYQTCKKQAEKQLLKSLAINSTNKTYISKIIGLKGKVRTKKKPKERNVIIEEITAGKKECKTKNKEKHQIRYLMDTIQNQYQTYKDEGGKYKFTTFYKHKPFYVISPQLSSRNTCLCVKHDNIELQFKTLKQNGVLNQNTIKEVLSALACNIKSYSCMYDQCDECKTQILAYNVEKLHEEVKWCQWERVDHSYMDKKQHKILTTKKTTKSTKTGTLNDLLHKFEVDVKLFKKHYFNEKHQQQEYQKGVRELQENEALIICDFSENYETKMAEEIQSMHFGAAKGQITLHTGMVYWQNRSQSFCSVSPNNSHQPPAIWAHLRPILHLIREETPEVSIIHFYTDGPSSQYRQKNNFFLQSFFTHELGLQYSTWSYFEAGHGKGVADGIGGSIKRTLDRRVCFGNDCTSAIDAYKILKSAMKVVKIFYIQDSEIEEMSSFLPQKLSTLKGTMQLHQIIAKEKHVLCYRDVSCFCGPLRGLCQCFSLQKHYFHPTESTSTQLSGTKRINSRQEINEPQEDDTIFYSYENDEVIFCELSETEIEQQNEVAIGLVDILHDSGNDRIMNSGQKNNEPQDDDSILVNPDKNDDDKCCEISGGTNELVDIGPLDIFYKTVNEEEEIEKIDLTVFENDVGDIDDFNPNKKFKYYAEVEEMYVNRYHRSDKENHAYFPNNSPSSTSICEPSSSKLSPLKRDRIMSKPNIKTYKKPEKSLKTIIKRTFKCDKCNEPLLLNRVAKCMVCKRWFCWECSAGQLIIDYICDACLGD